MKVFRPKSNLNHIRPPSVLSRPANTSKPVHHSKQISQIIPQPLLPLYSTNDPTVLQKLIQDIEKLTGLANLQLKRLDFTDLQDIQQLISHFKFTTQEKETQMQQMNKNIQLRTRQLDLFEYNLSNWDINLSKVDPSNQAIETATDTFIAMEAETINFNHYKPLIFQLNQKLARIYNEIYFQILNLDLNSQSKRFIERVAALMTKKKTFAEKSRPQHQIQICNDYMQNNKQIKKISVGTFNIAKILKQLCLRNFDFKDFQEGFLDAVGEDLKMENQIINFPVLSQQNSAAFWTYYLNNLLPGLLKNQLIDVLCKTSDTKQRYLIRKSSEITLVFDVLSGNLLESQQRINSLEKELHSDFEPENQILISKLSKLVQNIVNQKQVIENQLQRVFNQVPPIDIKQLSDEQLIDPNIVQVLKNQNNLGQQSSQSALDQNNFEIQIMEQACTTNLLQFSNINVITSLEPFFDQINDQILSLVIEHESYSKEQRYEAHRTLMRNYSQQLQQQNTLIIQQKQVQNRSAPTTIQDLQKAEIKKRKQQQKFKSYKNPKTITQLQERTKKEISAINFASTDLQTYYE